MTGTVGTAADTSPEALLKQAVTGAKPAMKSATKAAPNPAVAAVAAPTPWLRRVDPRLAGAVQLAPGVAQALASDPQGPPRRAAAA